jgi:hypothetical protein
MAPVTIGYISAAAAGNSGVEKLLSRMGFMLFGILSTNRLREGNGDGIVNNGLTPLFPRPRLALDVQASHRIDGPCDRFTALLA